MLLRKQTAYAQIFQATMEFSPSRAGYEAGVVLWWNQFSHATIGVALVELPGGEKVQTLVRRSPTGQAGVMNVSNHPVLYLTSPRLMLKGARARRPRTRSCPLGMHPSK